MLAGIGAGYLGYSVKHTMDAMYEPLPTKAWTSPVFERENAQADADQVSGSGTSKAPPLPSGGGGIVPASHNGSEAMPDTQVDPIENDFDRLRSIDGKKLTDEQVQQLLHPDLDRHEPFCILLLGVDERKGDRGRSDTMILISVNPAKQSALAISIPRDTRMLLPERESYDKINHAYAFGGTALSVAAVERLFGVPIAYYMKTNMEGIVDIVDTLGGVKVNNPWAFDFEGASFPKGELNLGGYETLLYVRMRYEDPKGDFGRTQRQREVLSTLVDQVASFRSLGKLPHILSRLSEDVRTNLTSGAMLDLATDYRPAIEQVDTMYLSGTGKKIKGIYYYTVEPEERQRIQSLILAHLLPTSFSKP